MTVAIDGGSDCFRWYRSGILSESDDCSTNINHAVTLVAHTAGELETVCTTTNVWNCDDCDPCDKADCTPRHGGDEFETPHGRGLRAPIHSDDCCFWESVTNCSEVMSSGFWTIQNSWGSGWGDAGFAHIEVSRGRGVIHINYKMEWVTVE